MKRRQPLYWRVIIGMTGIIFILLLLSRIKRFSDFYTTYIYSFISDIEGRISDMIPFALGELMMYAGVLVVFLLVVFSVILLFAHKVKGYKSFAVGYMKTVLAIVLTVLVVYELNWFIPFSSSYIRINADTEYTVEELQILRNYIVEEMNVLALEAERDDEGHLIVSESVDSDVIKAMRVMSDEYPRLTGYYPEMKPALCTDILDVMGIGGFTYPYIMEITYNAYEKGRMYYPVLYAHELCHHHGYYQEDEADFLSYIGCISSENIYLRYMGFHQMYYLVEEVYYNSLIATTGDTAAAYSIYKEQPQINEYVLYDELVDKELFKEAYQSGTLHASEELKEYAGKVAETGWNVQAVILEDKFYSGSIRLLLEYFDGELY